MSDGAEQYNVQDAVATSRSFTAVSKVASSPATIEIHEIPSGARIELFDSEGTKSIAVGAEGARALALRLDAAAGQAGPQ